MYKGKLERYNLLYKADWLKILKENSPEYLQVEVIGTTYGGARIRLELPTSFLPDFGDPIPKRVIVWYADTHENEEGMIEDYSFCADLIDRFFETLKLAIEEKIKALEVKRKQEEIDFKKHAQVAAVSRQQTIEEAKLFVASLRS